MELPAWRVLAVVWLERGANARRSGSRRSGRGSRSGYPDRLPPWHRTGDQRAHTVPVEEVLWPRVDRVGRAWLAALRPGQRRDESSPAFQEECHLMVRSASIVVIATGGTIASRPGHLGVVAAVSGAELVDAVPGLADEGPIEVQDLMNVNAYRLEAGQMLEIARAVRAAAGRPDVMGGVVTHGTDTMEESAYLSDLLLGGDKGAHLLAAGLRCLPGRTPGGGGCRRGFSPSGPPPAGHQPGRDRCHRA